MYADPVVSGNERILKEYFLCEGHRTFHTCGTAHVHTIYSVYQLFKEKFFSTKIRLGLCDFLAYAWYILLAPYTNKIIGHPEGKNVLKQSILVSSTMEFGIALSRFLERIYLRCPIYPIHYFHQFVVTPHTHFHQCIQLYSSPLPFMKLLSIPYKKTTNVGRRHASNCLSIRTWISMFHHRYIIG